MPQKVGSMSVFSKEDLIKLAQVQAANVKVKTIRKPKYSRKGYCKALPKSALTDKASQTILGTLIKGTESSFKRNVDQTDARPKNSLADRRLMRDVSNVPENWLHYPEFVHGSVKLHDQAGIDVIFQELIRLKLLARSEDYELLKAKGMRMTKKQHRCLVFFNAKGNMEKVAAILQEVLNSNQVRG